MRLSAMPPAVLLAACAVGHASPAARQGRAESPAPARPYLQPPPFVPLESAPAEPEPRRTTAQEDFELCARDVKAGTRRCLELPPSQLQRCFDACFVDWGNAKFVVAPAILPVSVAPPASANTRPPPLVPSDPFAVALGDCLRRVREGGAEPVCHFLRPLDAMEFGQRHCDAKCAALTAEDRGHGASGPELQGPP